MVKEFKLGDVLELKKPHACGNKNFEVIRMGMDIKIKCTECERIIMLERPILEKRAKKIIKSKED